jgi:hypothetical protein
LAGDETSGVKPPEVKQPPRDDAPPFHLSAIPQLHINIQLHVSPETTADQIDKIFESMAKHLKGFASKGT